MNNQIEFSVEAPQECYFLILPGFLPLDLAGPLQVMLSANNHCELYRIHYLGPCADVAMKGGLMLQQLTPLPDVLPEGSRLIIAGLSQTEQFLASEQGEMVIQWLKQQRLVKHLSLITICSGALIAAKSGFFARKQCTTHHDLLIRLADIEPGANILSDRLFVRDGNIWSSAGISSGVDMMLAVLESDSHAQLCAQVARDMVVYLRRSGLQGQANALLAGRNHLQRRIHNVQDLITRQPELPHTLAGLAEFCHMSSRNLSRTFKQATGQSVQQYITAIRLDLAEKLLRETLDSLEQIVVRCGFNSTRNFNRAWAQKYAQSPARYRKNFQ